MRFSIQVLIIIAFPSFAFSDTLVVPDDYLTIQTAIYAANDGDTVLVKPGTYMENINFFGKAITVTSSQGPYFTKIDGNQSGSVVTFNSGEGIDSVIENFMIANGNGNPVVGRGGGIYCENASPLICNNIISGNSADSYGGGIYCIECSPTISNNTISNNSAEDDGGGIFCWYSASIINDNDIVGNSTEDDGGGICCSHCTSSIYNNVISANKAKDEGAGIYCTNYTTSTITSNKLSNNISNGNGGGISFKFDSTATIINNNIAKNTSYSGNGGGIACLQSSSAMIENNIITNNYSYFHGGGIYYSAGPSIDITNNIIFNNSANYSGGGMSVVGLIPYASISNNIISNNIAIFYGGGIRCISCSPTLANNTIQDNSAGARGGGIYCEKSSPFINNNIILNNSNSSTHQGGGGLYFNDFSFPVINNNIISLNKTNSCGGGIFISSSSPRLINNTICNNSAAQMGGGIYCYSSSCTITNGIHWNNEALEGAEIWIGAHSFANSIVFIMHSDLKDSKSSIYVQTNSTLGWGSGMIDADPIFVNPDNCDFHLFFSSPCIDTGDNSLIIELTDFEGDPRIAFGTVDMGADEFYTHLYCTGDESPGGEVEIKFVGKPDSTPLILYVSTDILNNSIHTKWGKWWNEWWLGIPISGQIDLGSIQSSSGIYILPATIPPSIPGPYTIYMQAFIEDSLTNLCELNVNQ